MKHHLRLALLVSGLALLSACSTVPITGRSQLLMVTPQEEMQLGLTEFGKLKQTTKISTNARVNASLQRVGRRIAAVAPLPNAQWEFVLFESKEVNAFCLPGGKVGVYTGILPIAKNESGLAAIIGHEVAHAVAHHGGERMSEAMLVQLGGSLLNKATEAKTDATRVALAKAYGLSTQLGVMLPHSRKHELEADHLGLVYMARAGYDPHGAVELWQRFAEFNRQQGNAPISFLSTHPVDQKRIEQLQQLMPQAMAEYKPVQPQR
jgi:predicted Zn-dependent protease